MASADGVPTPADASPPEASRGKGAASEALDRTASPRPPPASFTRSVRAAVLLLTRVPIGGFPYSDAEWRASAAHLPLVGAAIGALLAVVNLALSRAGSLVAAVGTLVASLLLTGALHEDGLADTADALGGGSSRERILEILKDSRIGSYGGAAIASSLLLRAALLDRLGPLAPCSLVLAQCVSRVVPVWLMARLPYVTAKAVAKSGAVTGADGGHAVVASAWALVVLAGACAAGLVPLFGVLATSVAAVSSGAWLAWRFSARLGGITGDFLGAAQQVSECASLLALALVVGGGR